MKAKSPLDIWPFLPDTCESLYGESKMAIATRLVNRVYTVDELAEKMKAAGENADERLTKLAELLAPAVREITIGTGEKAVRVGGDDVMFRHQLTFYNKTKIAVDVWDTMTADELKERLRQITDFRKFYVGRFLTLDMAAVRSVSGDPEKFAACVSAVAASGLPIILCTKDPALMRAGLRAADGKNPLMYAADERNWKEMTALALEFDVPLVVSAPGDPELLKSMAMTAEKNGVSKLVLDPGTFTGKRFKETFDNLIKIRKAVLDKDETLAWPILTLPVKTRTTGADPVEADRAETVLASAMIVRYADLMIVHGCGPHEILPLVHMADMIYTDPRTPAAVDAKLYRIGTPDDDSPILFTTNFALTYYTVESDLASAKIDCFLLAVNTGGLGVEAATAGGQLTAQTVKAALDAADLDISKTKHKTLIIPGLAARLQGDLEKLLGITVLTGPTDSGRIPKWLEENRPEKSVTGKKPGPASKT